MDNVISHDIQSGDPAGLPPQAKAALVLLKRAGKQIETGVFDLAPYLGATLSGEFMEIAAKIQRIGLTPEPKRPLHRGGRASRRRDLI